MFKRFLGIILSLSLIVTMSACGSGDSLIGKDDEEQTYENKAVVNLSMNNIKTLNPVVSSDEDTYQISRLIYQSLFVLDETLKPEMDLAESYEISKNKRSVTIKLDSDARFSDGEKVTSEDVAFSIKAYQKAGKKSSYYGNVKNIESVEKDGSSKIKITFSKYGGGISRLTFPILPSHKESVSDLQESKSNFKPIGSGQYKVKKYVKDDSLVLKPNSEYSGEKAENTLTFKVYPNERKVLNLMSGNIVSYLVLTDTDRNSDIGCTDLRNEEFASNRLLFAGLNTERTNLASADVRKAICYAINTESLLKKYYYGSGVIADSIFYPGYMGITQTDETISYNTKKAESLLEEAGWKDKNKDGYLENAKKKKVTLTIAVNESREETAEYIASALDDLQIRCKVVSYSKKKFKAALKKGKYDIYIGEMTFADYYDMTDMIGGNTDYVGCSSELVSLAQNAQRCLEEEDLVAANESLIKKLNEETVYFPMIYITYSYVLSDEMRGEPAPVFNNIYRGCSSWYSAYPVEEDSDSSDSE